MLAIELLNITHLGLCTDILEYLPWTLTFNLGMMEDWLVRSGLDEIWAPDRSSAFATRPHNNKMCLPQSYLTNYLLLETNASNLVHVSIRNYILDSQNSMITSQPGHWTLHEHHTAQICQDPFRAELTVTKTDIDRK